MATVYLATQQSLDRPVSIKVMEREALQDETSMQRFENEARTIAKLSHPGIVGIHEVGRTSDGRMYYIMPYLANGDLSQRDLRNDEPRIVDVLRTLLSALDYAHVRGFVHRDVKQENVLFDADNRPCRSRIRCASPLPGSRSAVRRTWRRSRHAATWSTRARTCTASACSPTKCWPANCRSNPPTRSRWR
jgi:serine/threonine protein kinase